MGKCQSQPGNDDKGQLIYNSSSQVVKNQHRSSFSFIKKHKDQPNDDFATLTDKIPVLSDTVQRRSQTLGPFKYQNCGKYTNGTELQPYKLKNGAIYVGQWHNGKIQGKGRYYLPDGSFFQGITKDNEIEGFGRIIHDNGDYFEGQLKQGVANGQGTYVENDITYKGQFKNNLQHGQGVQFSNLYEYRGLFEEGQKLKGTLILKNKDKYEYQGGFRNNKYHGNGTLINDVGKYDGQFHDGVKEGHGIFAWSDGSYYEGEYLNDEKHGKGKLYDKHKKLIKDGKWQRNQHII